MSIEQQRYQVRFDWGAPGAAAIGADADVIVWVDALPGGGGIDLAALPAEPWILAASVPDSLAVAEWIVDHQQRVGRRIVIAVIAAGESRSGGVTRFAVEDLLAAGAVTDALSRLGLDATSPEAASAEAAYRGLGRAVAHVLTASVSAQSTPPSRESLRPNPSMSSGDVRVLREGRPG